VPGEAGPPQCGSPRTENC